MSKQADENQTPLMKQYWDLKSQVSDSLLFFRMGDFYELFGQDAVEASRILEITLTSRDKNKANPTPMAGVPHHSVQGYIQKLLKAGKKVAIGEQLEPPTTGKAIVRREITRVFTPGVHFDVEGFSSNFLATALALDKTDQQWILACLDASTGEVLVSEPMESEKLRMELEALPIRHLLLSEKISEKTQEELTLASSVLVEKLPSYLISITQANDLLKQQYELAHLENFLPHPIAIQALATLVQYVLKTQQLKRLPHLKLPQALHRPQSLVLGPHTAQHLDLEDLYILINRTKTSMGARELKRRLLSPSCLPSEIQKIQNAVQAITPLHSKLTPLLSEIYDIERIMGRVNTGLANPRDTFALGSSLHTLSAVQNILSQTLSQNTSYIYEIKNRLEQLAQKLSPLTQEILKKQKPEPPLTTKDGGIFNLGTDSDLDRLITINEKGQQWLVDLETKERESTGISSLKVRYNRVFGYYIEITQAHLKNVPSHYQRKQTMVGAERFFTEELKKFEDEIINAAFRQKTLEADLFENLLETIRSQTLTIMEAAQILAEIDTLHSLAQVSQQAGWCFPTIDESLEMKIEAGRHPLVDQSSSGSFVPNDMQLSPSTRLTLMITGPNMGGKSTVMRQTALIVLLGQMGSAVPAKAAHWGTVSSLYTRIGAQDAIARGQSTFMVEMTELAYILHHADQHSLIILDEIGRGTSTYDGMSVAWATLEWICKQIRARTLFATHYHELTHLSSCLPSLANAHMAVARAETEKDEKLRFLYLLKEGPTNESFGIHVAQLAGLPSAVIQRAWKVLEELEAKKPATEFDLVKAGQMSLFTAPVTQTPMKTPMMRTSPIIAVEAPNPVPNPIIEELKKTDVNSLTPVQALNFVVRLQEISRESEPKSS